jgi:serine/threonine protein kinase
LIDTRQILEELQLKNVLATSPTGAVFLAEDPETGRDVVIKMVSCAVPEAEEEVRRRFLAMALAARSVRVPGMPALLDHGLTPEGDGFLVMEEVEGRSLDDVEEISPTEAINVLLDVLSCIEGLAGVETAHLNVIPDNIILTDSPTGERAVVLGYGTSASLFHAGAGVPVPAHDPHLAPEIVSGEDLPSEEAWRSDLFSLGVIACGVLGAEIEADGLEKPVVRIPAPVRVQLLEASPLETMLGTIMAPDPMERGGAPSELRDPLIRALPEVSTPVAAAETTVAPEPESAFDPNKTDPAYRPPEPSPKTPPTSDEEAPGPARPQVDPAKTGGGETGADGWPEVLFAEPGKPEEPAESDIDDEDTDIRNPVPEDVWVPSDIPARAAASQAESASGRADAGRRRVSRLEVATVAVVVVVLGSIIAFTWPTGGDETPFVETGLTRPVTVEERGGLVPPPPDDNLFDDLLAVQALVDGGDLEAARTSLHELEGRGDLSMGSDEAALYESLVTALAQAADRDRAVDDLRSGLDYGSIKMVRRGAAGLSGMTGDEISEVSGLAGDLERARRALKLHTEMWDAESREDHLAVVRIGGELERVLPGYGGAPEAREQAASAIAARAEGAAGRGQFDNAVAIYESLERVWPTRPGLAERIAWCRSRADEGRRAESVIAAALAMGEGGDPEGGLAKLDALDPDPRLTTEVEKARAALRTVLDGLDAQAPAVELAVDGDLGFKKGATVIVPLRVIDDYRVETVVVHARNEADDGFLRIPLERADDGLYHFTVTPELHGNKDVSFYVVATDRSGHTGGLGSEDNPQTIVRKRWFKKLG